VDKHALYLEMRPKIESVFEHYAANSEYYKRANLDGIAGEDIGKKYDEITRQESVTFPLFSACSKDSDTCKGYGCSFTVRVTGS